MSTLIEMANEYREAAKQLDIQMQRMRRRGMPEALIRPIWRAKHDVLDVAKHLENYRRRIGSAKIMPATTEKIERPEQKNAAMDNDIILAMLAKNAHGQRKRR